MQPHHKLLCRFVATRVTHQTSLESCTLANSHWLDTALHTKIQQTQQAGYKLLDINIHTVEKLASQVILLYILLEVWQGGFLSTPRKTLSSWFKMQNHGFHPIHIHSHSSCAAILSDDENAWLTIPEVLNLWAPGGGAPLVLLEGGELLA
jgi:hypothetical protein